MCIRTRRIVVIVHRSQCASCVNHDQVIQFVIVQVTNAHHTEVSTFVKQADVDIVVT